MSDKARTTQDIIDDLRRFVGGLQYTGDGTSGDIGAAADYLDEAADRLDELQAQIRPPCVWVHSDNGYHDTACGFYRCHKPRIEPFCPHCGGKITLNREGKT